MKKNLVFSTLIFLVFVLFSTNISIIAMHQSPTEALKTNLAHLKNSLTELKGKLRNLSEKLESLSTKLKTVGPQPVTPEVAFSKILLNDAFIAELKWQMPPSDLPVNNIIDMLYAQNKQFTPFKEALLKSLEEMKIPTEPINPAMEDAAQICGLIPITAPLLVYNISLNDISISLPAYYTLINELSKKFPQLSLAIGKNLAQIQSKAGQDPTKMIALDKIKKELNVPQISDIVLFYEAAGSIGRPELYDQSTNRSLEINNLDATNAYDPIFNFNFDPNPPISGISKNQIQQLPALFQSYEKLGAKYKTRNYGVLCGFYATYFAETFLKYSNNRNLLLQKLNDRETFDKKYASDPEFKSGLLADDFITQTLIPAKIPKHLTNIVIANAINNYCIANATYTPGEKRVHSRITDFRNHSNDKLAIILFMGNANIGHWVTIFVKKTNSILSFLITDSLGMDRRNDIRVKEWYEFLSRKN